MLGRQHPKTGQDRTWRLVFPSEATVRYSQSSEASKFSNVYISSKRRPFRGQSTARKQLRRLENRRTYLPRTNVPNTSRAVCSTRFRRSDSGGSRSRVPLIAWNFFFSAMNPWNAASACSVFQLTPINLFPALRCFLAVNQAISRVTLRVFANRFAVLFRQFSSHFTR